MPSPVRPTLDAHDTIANGQYGAIWSVGHTQQPKKTETTRIVSLRIVLKDDIAVYQPARRLAFSENRDVNKQIDECYPYSKIGITVEDCGYEIVHRSGQRDTTCRRSEQVPYHHDYKRYSHRKTTKEPNKKT
ncbi:hypothetical protein TNCV_1983861 [Trichonephila clavipes]|nr:hypothetical protein TNCV_1983861 [Trichonephila clavipes]